MQNVDMIHPRGLIMFTGINNSYCDFHGPFHFDTYEPSNSNMLSEFLTSLDNGTLLIGISVKEFTRHLQSAGGAFAMLGIPIQCIHFGGALAFISIIGHTTQYNYFRGYGFDNHNDLTRDFEDIFVSVVCSVNKLGK